MSLLSYFNWLGSKRMMWSQIRFPVEPIRETNFSIGPNLKDLGSALGLIPLLLVQGISWFDTNKNIERPKNLHSKNCNTVSFTYLYGINMLIYIKTHQVQLSSN